MPVNIKKIILIILELLIKQIHMDSRKLSVKHIKLIYNGDRCSKNGHKYVIFISLYSYGTFS
jgi:hypothetical protein